MPIARALVAGGLSALEVTLRIAATRNHYAHRTDRDDQVLDSIDLWDATETVKSLSHMALLREIGAQTEGIGRTMLDRHFAEYAMRE